MIAKARKEHIVTNNLFPEEQKRCACNSLGCIDQLLIDNMVMCDAKDNQKKTYLWCGKIMQKRTTRYRIRG